MEYLKHYIYFLVGINQQTQQSSVNNENSAIIFSAKHDGLYLYVARMLRPIWQMRCVDDNFCSKLNVQDCDSLLCDLLSLRSFLEVHSVHDISSKFIKT